MQIMLVSLPGPPAQLNQESCLPPIRCFARNDAALRDAITKDVDAQCATLKAMRKQLQEALDMDQALSPRVRGEGQHHSLHPWYFGTLTLVIVS